MENTIEKKVNNYSKMQLFSLSDLENLSFEIGNYQRGYKWGKKEILELLNDIDSFDSNSGFYCLQPLILIPDPQSKDIKKDNYFIKNTNEVVDGQQRLTSLFLTISYLKTLGELSSFNLYSINYNTRKRSGEFLSNSLSLLFEVDLSSLDEKELSPQRYNKYSKINELWNSFITKHKEYDNIDVYHFFIVSLMIKKWFSIYDKKNLNVFIEKLLHKVKLIWYEFEASADTSTEKEKVIKVFLNNNKNKIRLTSSELIKSLFILQIKNQHNREIAEFETNRFAMEWDMIENQLQEKSFWYFISSNNKNYNEGTHIDLLFDIINNKKDKDDAFHSYRIYEEKFNQNEDLNWDEVSKLYYKLLDWFNDKNFYHYIGFLINSKISDIGKINKWSLVKNNNGTVLKKDEFLKNLKNKIKETFSAPADIYENDEKKTIHIYSLDNLDYQKYYLETKRILLLFNVLYYAKNSSRNKFPFELYIQEMWSIEHINPQNPRELDNYNDFKNWYLEKDLSEEQRNRLNIIFEQNSSREKLKTNKEHFEELKKIEDALSSDTHKIENLALLDRNTNSSLGNCLFNEKREKILRFDKKGKADNERKVFIPIETRNVFTKSYSKTESLMENRWTLSDGEFYKQEIQERLKEFLPKEEK